MENNIEVNALGVNKGIGLLKLGELLGIKREEIMACGDGMNDLEMIREAGLGVAMANAVQEVKDAADFVTDSNEKDGVAKAIEMFAPVSYTHLSCTRFFHLHMGSMPCEKQWQEYMDSITLRICYALQCMCQLHC